MWLTRQTQNQNSCTSLGPYMIWLLTPLLVPIPCLSSCPLGPRPSRCSWSMPAWPCLGILLPYLLPSSPESCMTCSLPHHLCFNVSSVRLPLAIFKISIPHLIPGNLHPSALLFCRVVFSFQSTTYLCILILYLPLTRWQMLGDWSFLAGFSAAASPVWLTVDNEHLLEGQTYCEYWCVFSYRLWDHCKVEEHRHLLFISRILNAFRL